MSGYFNIDFYRLNLGSRLRLRDSIVHSPELLSQGLPVKLLGSTFVFFN